MEVINASLGRTGTSSFCEAMEILGYNCHHMKKLLADKTFESSKPFYDAALNRDEANWDEVYAGYNACADWTGAYFYKGLFARYPNAKVILTERNFEDWFSSMKDTIYKTIRDGPSLEKTHPRYYFRQLCRTIIIDGHIEDNDKYLDEKFIREYYDKHIKEVKELVPADQLYILKLGEGWEGLCKFLGKAVPEKEYPRVNSKAQFNAKVQATKARFAAEEKAQAVAEEKAKSDAKADVKDLTVGS